MMKRFGVVLNIEPDEGRSIMVRVDGYEFGLTPAAALFLSKQLKLTAQYSLHAGAESVAISPFVEELLEKPDE